MVYGVHADTKLMVGGWPQFFRTVFHVSAKSKEEAERAAKLEFEKSPVTYKKLSIEYLGREYKVFSNEELRVCGVRYEKDSITKVTLFEGTMQIIIDHANFAVWRCPADYEAAVKDLFSKMKSEEI